MLTKLFIKKKSGPKLSPLARTLLRLADINMSSANCTLLPQAGSDAEPEDLGRAMFFKTDGKLLIKERAIYITTPEGIKAENQDQFHGIGDTLSLWFLYDHVPRIVECRVDERVHFPADLAASLDPKVGIGYKITPTSDILKQDKRNSLRFSHLPGQGVLPVYPQILFDLHVHLTDQTYPEEGAIPPRIEDLRTISPDVKTGKPGAFSAQDLVPIFKKAIRANITENRNVHVSKPFLEEKFNRSVLLELGYCDVLGLGSEDLTSNLHIKKPLTSRTKDRRDPSYLIVGDQLVLHYGSRQGLDGKHDYYELVTEVSKGGLENLTIRPTMHIKEEDGFRAELCDFSVNGARFTTPPTFLAYILGKNYHERPLEEQMHMLYTKVLQLNFYTRLRFNRDTEVYRPELPRRISILGKIVRCVIEWEDEEEQLGGQIVQVGIKFMYDPVTYSRDDFRYDQWEMIRAFNENHYFKEVHKSLNGLIAYLENQTKE